MLLDKLPEDGRVFILTGPNGSGKTRALAQMTDVFLSKLNAGSKELSRLICMSGTVLDKFPRSHVHDSMYVYFGRRVNSNMFSEIAPYRRLVDFLLADSPDWSRRARVAKEVLASISLGGIIYIKFRRGRNTKDSTSDLSAENLDIKVNLDTEYKNQENIISRAKQLREGKIHVSSFMFEKGREQYDINDLSSGERSYALSVLALSFSVTDKSVIIYDEPENSLHPKWQESVTRDLWRIIGEISEESRLIVATHSPLVVAGAMNNLAYIHDLESSAEWSHSRMYGNTSDTVLREQFGLFSARSITFMSALQDCLTAMIDRHVDPESFRAAADNVLSMSVRLESDDPLFLTLRSVKEAREAIK